MWKKPIAFVSFLIFLASCGGGSSDSGNNNQDNSNPNDSSPAYEVYGLDFGPFTELGQNPNAGSSVSISQIRDLMKTVSPYTEWVRAFGSMNGVQNICQVAHENGLKCFGGAWLSDDLAANQREMDGLIEISRVGYVDAAVVGSEVLSRGDLSENELLEYMDQFMNAVPEIPVTTAEVYDTLLLHPVVMNACDFIFVNYYPYWRGIGIDHAVAAVHAWHNQVKAAANGKEIIISETGWPSDGETIGDAVASLVNASYFFKNMASWAQAEDVKVVYFEAFDEPWKEAYEGPQGSNWGIWTSDKIMKSGFQEVFDGATVTDNWNGVVEPGGPGTPAIELTYVPPRGSHDDLKGQVWHVMPADYRVVVYIYVVGSWWIKPYYANPTTVINPDGTFITDITTGGSDSNATSIVAYLIPTTYNPPLTYNQATLEANSAAFVKVDR